MNCPEISDDELSDAVAAADGWVLSSVIEHPFYANSKDAIYWAAERAGPDVIKAMRFELYELTSQMSAHHASARDDCIAYLRARKLWPIKTGN